MYIVAIGWAYVIFIMAITASSVVSALSIALFLGVLPIALFVYSVGGRKRRSVLEHVADNTDAGDSHPDQ